MPAEQNFTLLKKCRFNTETELMEALLSKRLKPSLNIKLGHLQGAKSLLHVFIERYSAKTLLIELLVSSISISY